MRGGPGEVADAGREGPGQHGGMKSSCGVERM